MLRQDQDRQYSLLVQEGKQLVYLERQKAFLRHRLQIAVKAVDDDDGGVTLGYGSTDERSEFAGRHLRGIDLMQGDVIRRDQRADLHSDPACPLDDAFGAFVKGEEG